MRIVLGHIYSRVYSKDVRALVIIREVCKARPDGYQFMPSYRDKSWDGYISLMKMNSFPTGLFYEVCEALEEKGYSLEIDWGDYDTPVHPYVNAVNPDILNGITLRDYQVQAIKDLLFFHRGVAQMATNAGKTEVFAGLLKVLEGKQSLVVVHRKELLHQTVDRLKERLGHFVGKIGDGIHEPCMGVNVAMVQTLHNMIGTKDFKNWISTNEILIVDECHHASSNQMMDVLYKVPGMYRYGFSGTPLKYDDLADMKLQAITGKVLVEISNEDLISMGYSAVPVVYMFEVFSESKEDWKEDYHSAYEKQIVKNEIRNSKIIDLARGKAEFGDVVLILVNRIEHGEYLTRETGGNYSTGEHTTAHRKAMLDDMRDGVAGVYVATTIFDEGVDVPSINTLILAGGGKSDLKLLQRVGRGMRAKEGENVIEIYDFIDDTNKYLLKHTHERVKVYVKEGFQLNSRESIR